MNHRDFWDWLVIVAAVVGAVGATATAISIIYTAHLFRRRPEVSISWYFDGRPWSANETKNFQPGDQFEGLVAVRNVGNATGETTITNTIAANVFYIVSEGQGGIVSGNPIAGKHTNGIVTFVKRERRFYPNLMWMIHFTIGANMDVVDRHVEHELVFVVEDDRFSSNGKRRLKCRAFPLEEHETTTKVRRIIQALPNGEVVCGPGYRRSTRKIRIVNRDEPQSSSAAEK